MQERRVRLNRLYILLCIHGIVPRSPLLSRQWTLAWSCVSLNVRRLIMVIVADCTWLRRGDGRVSAIIIQRNVHYVHKPLYRSHMACMV